MQKAGLRFKVFIIVIRREFDRAKREAENNIKNIIIHVYCEPFNSINFRQNIVIVQYSVNI